MTNSRIHHSGPLRQGRQAMTHTLTVAPVVRTWSARELEYIAGQSHQRVAYAPALAKPASSARYRARTAIVQHRRAALRALAGTGAAGAGGST